MHRPWGRSENIEEDFMNYVESAQLKKSDNIGKKGILFRGTLFVLVLALTSVVKRLYTVEIIDHRRSLELGVA